MAQMLKKNTPTCSLNHLTDVIFHIVSGALHLLLTNRTPDFLPLLLLLRNQPNGHVPSGRQEDGHPDRLSGDHHPAAGHHHLPHPLVPVRLQGAGEGEKINHA